MPANNKKTTRAAKIRAATIDVGQAPAPVATGSTVKKTLQEALVAGLEDPAQFARDFLDCDPYEAQCDFLRQSRDCSEANFVAGNRVGKTWTAGIILLWRAFYRYISPFTAPDKASPHVTYKAVSTSLTHDQAKLAWNYAYTFATESKRFRPFVADVVHTPFPTMLLKTRNEAGDTVTSEIWSRSLAKGGVHLLGHSIAFLLVDECAYVKGYPTIEDEVLRMRLADQGGALFRISTPNGRNFFYDYFLRGMPNGEGVRDPRYYSQRIQTWDNPYVSRAFLEEQRERMLPEFYAQNVLAEFVSLSDFFKLEVIQALYAEQDYSLPVEPVKGATYVMGVDLGAMRDPTVVIVWRVDTTPMQVVYVGAQKNSNWRAQRAFVMQTWHTYTPAKTVVDATGVGMPPYQTMIEEDGLENSVGHVITGSNKPDTLTRVQDAAQRKKFVFPYVTSTKELINQMSFYRLDDKDINQDQVIALAMTNLAYEDWSKTNTLDTTIYDDLAVISIERGGEAITGADVYGPGTLFGVDPKTGLFIPIGGTYGLL